jgi:iron only hydrogenase large subunit-like protein
VKKIFFLIFLTACTSKNLNNSAVNIDMNVSFDEFKNMIKIKDIQI